LELGFTIFFPIYFAIRIPRSEFVEGGIYAET
jgi:hypothetical protein